MAGTFKFELVTPERMLIPERAEDQKEQPPPADAEQAIVPGMDGQFTVLPGHAPVISTLRPGVLEVALASGRRRVFVRGGIAEVEPDRLTILAQHFVDLDKIDPEVVAAEIRSAEALLADAKDDRQRMVAEEALAHLKAIAA
jgi:F-type H+-transporting ATPase subunit epsilon